MSTRTLGKYVLRERLGRGGMAEVYQAYQPGLERLVAVKLLHAHLTDDPGFLVRFQREAQSVAQLRHPHIVQVYDFDVADGQPYMVMELIKGQSLKALLDERFARGERLPLADILRLFDAVLDAVDYAHARGLIHRDLKPANVLIDQAGRAVLTDFGIARLVDGERLTQTGITMGSPAYMSPEQGQGEPADARSDIYALGIMLFECLSGHVPFEGDSSVGVLLKHATAPIPSLRELRADLPEALEDILRTALAKRPDERYQSAAEMRAALHALSEETAPPATLPSPARRIGEAPGRVSPTPAARSSRRWLIGGGLSLALTVLVLAVLAAPRWLALNEAGRALRSGQARLAEGAYQLAVDDFSAALAADPARVEALAGRAQARAALGQIDEALADVEAWIAAAPNDGLALAERARLTAQYLPLDDPAAVLADLDRAVQLAPASARAHFLRGWALLNFPLIGDARDPAGALPDLNEAARLAPADAEAQFTLAQAYFAAGQAAEALPPAGRAVELAPAVARHWTLRAHIRAVLGDFVAAVDDLNAALKVESEPVAQAVWLAERAYLHLHLGDRLEARTDAAAALAAAPGSALAQVVVALAAGEAPPPEALQAARFAPADDPIWQAILREAGP